MTITTLDVEDANRLVGFGLDTRALPGVYEEYADLVRRYRLEDPFRSMVDAVCAGLELDILSADDQGFILAPRPGSIFSFSTSADWESGMTPERRRINGFILFTVIAVAYPNPDALERTSVVRVRVSQVERALREAVRVVIEAAPEEGESLMAANEVNALPTTKAGAQRQVAKSSSHGAIRAAFDHLVEHNLARRAADPDGDTEYQMLPRLRVNVREMALPEAHKTLLALHRLAASTDSNQQAFSAPIESDPR
jgi:hypothetical protein